MKKPAIVFILAAAGIGIALYVLKSRAPEPHDVQVATPPATKGVLRELNEVMVQATPPAASAAPVKPADNAATAPANNNSPPPLAREFDSFFSMAAPMKALHEQFEQEPREEPWATLMESKWQTAFGANPELLAHGTPEVYCRTTRCEVRLVSYKPSTLDQGGWVQLITKGAGTRAAGDQSAPLVSGIRNTMMGNIENNGARVILFYYEYGRDTPAAR